MLKGKRDGRSPDPDTLKAEKGKSKQKKIIIKKVMKKVVKLSLLSVLIFFGLVGFVNDVSAKKIQINTTVKDANGKTWEIKGWVDMCCPPSVEHWDLWVTDGDGKKHHFVGIAYQSGNGGKTGNESNGYKMNVYSETGIEEPLDVIPWGNIIVEMKKITANTNE